MWRPEGKHTSRIHQVCIIISEAIEDDDGGNNPVINSQDVNQGNSHRKEREKVYVSAGEWRSQPWHDNTCGFKKRSFTGVPVRFAPAQETAIARTKRAKEKSRIQRHSKQNTMGRTQ
jgi:hypothetical protein